ncbi:hypothetical protein KJ564_14640 [bacterium]|nr:hypothetical protein [bacterium]MBU1881915.1 hypothetical protein [bacterium]
MLSLCRHLKLTLFANTKITNGSGKTEGENLLISQGGADLENRSGCPLIVADLMEKVSSYMLEDHPGELAALIFSQEQSGQREHLLKAIMQLYYFTPLGRGLQGILGSPMTMYPTLAPGLQSANVFAYIISQFHNGRAQMREFYRELEGLQYISVFDKDEFELRGMNSFRMD